MVGKTLMLCPTVLFFQLRGSHVVYWALGYHTLFNLELEHLE